MAAARWAIRSPTQPSLPPIRTLSYFLPAIDEVLTLSPERGYVDYLAAKLQSLIAKKERLLAAEPTSPRPRGRQTRQISAVSDRR